MDFQTLLSESKTRLSSQLEQIRQLEEHSFAELSRQPEPGAWSALGCINHLNRYCRYYFPLLEKEAGNAGAAPKNQELKYSWLGRKSIEMVTRPPAEKKQKTLKRMNPIGEKVDLKELAEFREWLEMLLKMLDEWEGKDLNGKKIRLEFMKLLRLRTGEALLFLLAHQERHLDQARRAIRRALKAS